MIVILGWYVLFRMKKKSLLGIPIKQGVKKVKKLLKWGVDVRIIKPPNRMSLFSYKRLLEHMKFFKVPLLEVVPEYRLIHFRKGFTIYIKTSDFYLIYKGRWGPLWRRVFKKLKN